MKHFGWRWLVVSSVFFAALAAVSETRPQYGGTLHVSAQDVLTSLDPSDVSQDSFLKRNVTGLLFNTLVTIDESGRSQSALAVSWQASRGNQHWRFVLRKDVHFHDGTPVTAQAVAASLRAVNPAWNVSADANSVVVDVESADPQMLFELALPRNAVWKKDPGNLPLGTGPFRIMDWKAGRELTLAANEDYWGGRPYLDSIEIEMGKSSRDEMTALEVGKSDVIPVSPEQVRRISLSGGELLSSSPTELVALVFAREAQSDEDKLLRESLSLAIDRGSIRNVILQGTGDPTATLLPNWMSGYAFVFSTNPDLALARHQRGQVRSIPNWSLGYGSHDAMDRLLAERIALNAKDAGLSLQLTSSGNPDLRLVRIPLVSVDPWTALGELADALGFPLSKHAGSIEDLYAVEQSLIASRRVIPLFHLPADYALSPAVRSARVGPNGRLSLADAWLGARQP